MTHFNAECIPWDDLLREIIPQVIIKNNFAAHDILKKEP
jgi:hypothetical protein